MADLKAARERAQFALKCLYLEVDITVADAVGRDVLAALNAYQAALDRAEEALRPFAVLAHAWESGHYKAISEIPNGETIPPRWVRVGDLRLAAQVHAELTGETE